MLVLAASTVMSGFAIDHCYSSSQAFGADANPCRLLHANRCSSSARITSTILLFGTPFKCMLVKYILCYISVIPDRLYMGHFLFPRHRTVVQLFQHYNEQQDPCICSCLHASNAF